MIGGDLVGDFLLFGVVVVVKVGVVFFVYVLGILWFGLIWYDVLVWYCVGFYCFDVFCFCYCWLVGGFCMYVFFD